MKPTGERVTTAAGGHNPTWQRHVAAYRLVADLLPDGTALDLGCGIGHSYRRLGRSSIGLDLDRESLRAQGRPTVQADMCHAPVRTGAVSAVVSVQSLEHVRRPEEVVAEAARVLVPTGAAVFVTPNRLTFGRPDEIIDPWHYVEFDAADLAALCGRHFSDVEILGLHGRERYLVVREREMARMERLLAADFLRLRRLASRRVRQWIYSISLRRMRDRDDPLAAAVEEDDFYLRPDGLDGCLDLVAHCRHPLPPPGG